MVIDFQPGAHLDDDERTLAGSTVLLVDEKTVEKSYRDVSPDSGDFESAFTRMDSERGDIFDQSNRLFDKAFAIWTTELLLLHAELDETFHSYPCGRITGAPDATLVVATAVIRFRSAEVRRSAELQRVWNTHLRDVSDAFTEFSRQLMRFDRVFFKAKQARRMPQPRPAPIEIVVRLLSPHSAAWH